MHANRNCVVFQHNLPFQFSPVFSHLSFRSETGAWEEKKEKARRNPINEGFRKNHKPTSGAGSENVLRSLSLKKAIINGACRQM